MVSLKLKLSSGPARVPDTGEWRTRFRLDVEEALGIPPEVFVKFVDGSRFAFVAQPEDFKRYPVGRDVALELILGHYRESFMEILIDPSKESFDEALFQGRIQSLCDAWERSGGAGPFIRDFTVTSGK